MNNSVYCFLESLVNLCIYTAAGRRTNPLMASPSSSNLAQDPDKAAMACAEGNVEELEKMLQGGVSVDHVAGKHKWTLLHMAVYHCQVHCLIILQMYFLTVEFGLSELHFALLASL